MADQVPVYSRLDRGTLRRARYACVQPGARIEARGSRKGISGTAGDRVGANDHNLLRQRASALRRIDGVVLGTESSCGNHSFRRKFVKEKQAIKNGMDLTMMDRIFELSEL